MLESVVTPYPMDFDALQKGDYITPEVIENITGEDRYTQAYSMAILRFGQTVVERLADRTPPLYVVVKQEKSGLRILDDESASSYTFGEAERALKMMKRNYGRMTRCVDPTEFNDGTKRMHENRIMITSAMIRGAMDSRKEALLIVKKRPEIPQLNIASADLPLADTA